MTIRRRRTAAKEKNTPIDTTSARMPRTTASSASPLGMSVRYFTRCSHGEPMSDRPFAQPDFEREARWGLPEVVLGIGKTDEQIAEIVGRLRDANTGPVLVTKTTRSAYDAVLRVAPEAEFF